LALEPGQPFQSDFGVAQSGRLGGQADRLDGAGGAYAVLPADAPQGMFDAHQFEAGWRVGLGVACWGAIAVSATALGIADAAHLQAFTDQWLETLADDELGTAAANVGDQAVAWCVGDAVRYAQVDQAGFLAAGDDLYRVAKYRFGTTNEFAAVARL